MSYVARALLIIAILYCRDTRGALSLGPHPLPSSTLASTSTSTSTPVAASSAASATPSAITPEDERYLRRALELAARAQGRTRPNPVVGCVLVKDGVIIGEGYHVRAGQPHAEAVALQDALSRLESSQQEEATKGATAYVTLEPCNHFGRTPPCSHALVRRGISRVVAGLQDPDPRVSGGGLKYLMEHNVSVTLLSPQMNVNSTSAQALYRQCRRLNRPFLWRVHTGKAAGVALCRLGDSCEVDVATPNLQALDPASTLAALDASPEVDCLVLTPEQCLKWFSEAASYVLISQLPPHVSIAVYSKHGGDGATRDMERCVGLLADKANERELHFFQSLDVNGGGDDVGEASSSGGIIRQASLSPSRLLSHLSKLSSNAAAFCCDSREDVQTIVAEGAAQWATCHSPKWDGRDGGIAERMSVRAWLKELKRASDGTELPWEREEHKGPGYFTTDL